MIGVLAGLRILLVEDELLIAQMLRGMLEDMGCAVVGPAARVNEAMDLIETEPVDAAVLDISLNRQLSYPVADALQARGVPFLFSTAYDPDRVHDRYGACSILQKPYRSVELERALTILLAQRDDAVATEPSVSALSRQRTFKSGF